MGKEIDSFSSRGQWTSSPKQRTEGQPSSRFKNREPTFQICQRLTRQVSLGKPLSLSVSQFPHLKNSDFNSSQPALQGCREEPETVFPEGRLFGTGFLTPPSQTHSLSFSKRNSRKLGSRHSLETHTHLNVSRPEGSFSEEVLGRGEHSWVQLSTWLGHSPVEPQSPPPKDGPSLPA